MITQQSHHDRDTYLRYHSSIWISERVRRLVDEALPLPFTILRLGGHYFTNPQGRDTPDELQMPAPGNFTLIDVSLYREDGALSRVNIRTRHGQRDLCMVLEFPSAHVDIPRVTVVTAFWNAWRDQHRTLDESVYEARPRSKKLASVPV